MNKKEFVLVVKQLFNTRYMANQWHSFDNVLILLKKIQSNVLNTPGVTAF